MILSGRAIAEQIEKEIHHTVSTLRTPPGLAVVLIGDNAASSAYVSRKRKACLAVGIESFYHPLPASTTEGELLHLIDRLNRDPLVDGILVQLPLPSHIKNETIVEAISPQKDVDGFHPENLGKLLLGHPGGFIPCTPLGIKVLLERSAIAVAGKEVVIVGRSSIVGKPLAALLMQPASGCNATVTVVHRQTHNLEAHTRRADLLVAAIGSPHFIKEHMVRAGAVVIDVGINRIDDPNSPKGYRIVGDVDFNQVEQKCFAITPVPNGVGPMTVAMLLHNTLLSRQRRERSF